MTAGGVSRPGLHKLLFHRATGNGTLKIDQKRLADELGVTRFSLNRVLRVMCDEGRIRQMPGTAGPHSRTYEITDPADSEPTLPE